MDFETMREAMRPIDAAYRESYRSIAETAIEEATDEDDFSDRLHEMVDSSWWITYTWPAPAVLMVSDNADAYAEAHGSEGMIKDGSIQWSRLAYWAMEADARGYAYIIMDDRKCDDCGGYVFGELPERPEAGPGERVALYCDGCSPAPESDIDGAASVDGPTLDDDQRCD